MTLIEVMVVVAIIGLMMSAVGYQVWKMWKEARIEATKQEIMTTKNAIQGYESPRAEILQGGKASVDHIGPHDRQSAVNPA